MKRFHVNRGIGNLNCHLDSSLLYIWDKIWAFDFEQDTPKVIQCLDLATSDDVSETI